MTINAEMDSCQHNFPITGLSQFSDIGQHLFKRHTAAATARMGHDTIGTKCITTVLNL